MKLKEFRKIINDPRYDDDLEVCSLDGDIWALPVKDVAHVECIGALLLFNDRKNKPICRWAVHLNGVTDTERNGV